MYIEKYWYNCIGGTDGSPALAGYLCDKGKE